MLYYIIPLLIIAGSLAAIIVMIVKKLPQLAALNVDSIAEEKESVVKNRIMLERLTRKVLRLKKMATEFIQPFYLSGQRFFAALYKRISELEKAAETKERPLKAVEVKQEIKNKLQTAETILDQSQFEQAEESYISILNLDPNNVDAYEGLIEVYIAQKDYKKGRETCRYIIKLLTKKGLGAEIVSNKNHRLAGIYADLGSIYQAEGKPKLAFGNFEKAVELEPSNPRFLDLLLKISILLKSKQKAWETFNALQNADPDNKKLPELKEEIEKIKEVDSK